MNNFTQKPKQFFSKIVQLDKIIYKFLPDFISELIEKYLRVEVIGLENIPKQGSAIIAPNHSGFLGFDAIIIDRILIKKAKRKPKVLTHHLWFLTKTTSIPAERLGFIEATYENGINSLKKNELIVLFPEGEKGNFKPSTRMYQLQEFKRGFVRMAIQTSSVIIPTLVIGAEETHINLSQLKFAKYLRGPILPLPLNIIPLPVKWKIIFLEPIELPFKPSEVDNNELVHDLTQEIQEKMQEQLSYEVRKRSSIFF